MKRFFQVGVCIQILLLGGVSSFATEAAVLRNGFSIRHERREVIGAVTRLYLGAGGSGYVDVPTAEIDHFEEAPQEKPAATAARTSAELREAFSTPMFKRDLGEVVDAASGRYRLDPDLVNSVIKAESGFNVRAVSPKGAQGLMQLMPSTASSLGVQDVFDPRANVEGGTRYLRELLERYNFDLVKALAAYNAGPLRVEQYRGVPPYYETRAYVARIVRDFNRKKDQQKSATALNRTPKSATQTTHSGARVATSRVHNPNSQAEPHASLPTN
jgi:transglycosylase-like protein with SLT domain